VTPDSQPAIRGITPAEIPKLCELLRSASLPVDDISDLPQLRFWAAEQRGEIVGVVGLECIGQSAMLRSLAVVPAFRSQGLGRHLVEHVERHARDAGYRLLALLTTSAERFFHGLGYSSINRASVPEDVKQTAQFRSLCPSSAVCMTKSLTQ